MNNLAADPDELRIHDLAFSSKADHNNTRGGRYLSQQGAPSNYTTVQNHPPPALHLPRPEKLKEKAESAISEARLLFRERSHQHPTKQLRREIPQPKIPPASCSRWEPGRVPASVSPSVNEGGPERKTESGAAPTQALGRWRPATPEPSGRLEVTAALDVRSSSARGS